MILVWRLCTDCSRRFSFWHKPGAQDMHALCNDCTARLHNALNGTLET